MWVINHFLYVGLKPLFRMAFEQQLEKDLKTIGLRIKKLRKSKDISQLDLEVKSGVERSDISKIENAKKNIELITIVKLATALGVETYELLKPLRKVK